MADNYYDDEQYMMEPRETFLERMSNDMTRRANVVQMNELKKTVHDPKMLKRIDDWQKETTGPTARGGRKPVKTELTPSEILGDFHNKEQKVAPKIVTHSKTKLNSNKPWDAKTWSNNTYLF
uniref:Uncharacterized protein n=2 Tax=Hemiselmis andersenii TaxID=464988 RepID=A0A6U2AF43_HEMAN